MSQSRLPEIVALEGLFAELPQKPHSHRATQTIAATFAEQHGMNPQEGWWTLMRIIQNLPLLASELPTMGAVEVANGVCEDLLVIFSPDRMANDVGGFLTDCKSEINHVQRGLKIFNDLSVNKEGAEAAATSLVGLLETLRGAVAGAQDLPESARAILMRQVDHLAISLSSFRDGGVAPFRKELYTAYGRLILELEPLNKKHPGAMEGVLKAVEAVAPLVEAVLSVGGISAPLLSLAAPVARLAIEAPKS